MSEKEEKKQTLESLFLEFGSLVDEHLAEMNNHLRNIEIAVFIIAIPVIIGLILLILLLLGLAGAARAPPF